MQRNGVTVILVSHALGDVEKVCNRAIWIDHGKMMAYGEARDVADQYARNQGVVLPVDLKERDPAGLLVRVMCVLTRNGA